MIWWVADIEMLDTSRVFEGTLRTPGLRCRLRAAWLVLTGKADAVIWRTENE